MVGLSAGSMLVGGMFALVGGVGGRVGGSGWAPCFALFCVDMGWRVGGVCGRQRWRGWVLDRCVCWWCEKLCLSSFAFAEFVVVGVGLALLPVPLLVSLLSLLSRLLSAGRVL